MMTILKKIWVLKLSLLCGGILLIIFGCGRTTGFEAGEQDPSDVENKNIFPEGTTPTGAPVATGGEEDLEPEDVGNTLVTDEVIAACSFFQSGSLSGNSEYLKFYKPNNAKKNPDADQIFDEIYKEIPLPWHDRSISGLSSGVFKYERRFFEFEAKLGSNTGNNVSWVYPYVSVSDGNNNNIPYYYKGRVTICDAPVPCKLELRLVKRELTVFEGLPAASVSRMCK